MSSCNFAPSLAAVLVHEGGFVDDPRDPGGRTSKGITQHVYDDWRAGEKLVKRDVKLINDYEVGAIYRANYWNACRCDDLPAGVDYCIFDFAVNSGRDRAARFLQRALGVIEDGHIGLVTLAAVKALDHDAIAGEMGLIEQVCQLRLDFLKHLKTFDTFGRGWTRRVEEVREKAKEMAG